MTTQTETPSTETLAILLSLVKDIANKVDDLAKDHVTTSDMTDLRRYIDNRLDRQEDRQFSKDELNARLTPLEKTVARLEELSFSETQRILSFVGSVLGILSALYVLTHLH